DRRRRVGLHHEAGRHRSAAVADASLVVQVRAVASKVEQRAAQRDDVDEIELALLLEGIYRRYGFDFREYAPASLRRRVLRRVHAEGLTTVSALQDKLLRDPACMERLLLDLSINVTAMFRDPTFYVRFREKVVPLLRTYPFTPIWVAG